MTNASEHTVGHGPDDAAPAADPQWLSAVEQNSWRAFVDGSNSLLAALDKALITDSGFCFDEYRILVMLSENPTRRMSDLSQGGFASRSTVSRQVSRLVDRGDVERVPDATDARNRLVRISDLGRSRLHEAAKDHVRLVRELLMDRLTPEQIEEMGRVFTDIAKAVHHAEGGDAPRTS